MAPASQDVLIPEYGRNLSANPLGGNVTSPSNGPDHPVTSDVTLPVAARDTNNERGGHIPPGGICYLKLLVSNLVAGSIIGPKGATVSHISDTTGCTVKLSNSASHFPGTNDRVIVMWGKLRDLQAAFVMIIEKIRDGHVSTDAPGGIGDAAHGDPRGGDVTTTVPGSGTRIAVKIVVPNSAVSQLIGKQGRAIKDLQDTTGTKIQISNRDEQQLKERIVTIMGLVENVTQAAMHVLESIQSDPHIKDHTKLNYMPSTSPFHALRNNPLNCYLPGMPMFAAGMHPMNLAAGTLPTQLRPGTPGAVGGRPLGPTTTDAMASVMSQQAASNKCYMPMYTPMGTPAALHPGVDFGNGMPWNTAGSAAGPIMDYTLEVPDACVGFLIGKQGVTLQSIQQQAGVKIRISGKGDFVPGTENRRLTITGSPMGIQYAAALLQQRLHEMEDISRQRGSNNGTSGGPHLMGLGGEGQNVISGDPSLTSSPSNANSKQGAVFRGVGMLEYQCPTAHGGYPNFSVGR